MDHDTHAETPDSGWKSLYRAGGAAALIAGVIFRRNLGVEVSLFSPQKPPESVAELFALLQTNRLLGLTYLNVFDLVNYGLLAVMFLALYVCLKRYSPSWMAIAAALGGLGIAIYSASNTALSMISLSDQYAAAAGEAQRAGLVAAGQALLALNRFSSLGAHPGTGGYLSLLFVAIAGMIISVVMLRSTVFNRAAGVVGLLANGFDLAYCLAYIFVPGVGGEVLAVSFIPAAGLFLMVWHILIGIRLFQLSLSPERSRQKSLLPGG